MQRGHRSHISPFPATRGCASGGWERLTVTTLEVRFLTKSAGKGQLRWEQEGQGGTGSSCCLQFPHISRSEPCTHRAERVEPTAWGPRGATLAEVRDSAEAQRADWHAPRFFGSVGNASLDSLPSGHNQTEGRSWKLQAGIYEPYPH